MHAARCRASKKGKPEGFPRKFGKAYGHPSAAMSASQMHLYCTALCWIQALLLCQICFEHPLHPLTLKCSLNLMVGGRWPTNAFPFILRYPLKCEGLEGVAHRRSGGVAHE